MADTQTKQQQQQEPQRSTEAIKTLLPDKEGISKTKILAAVSLFPVGGFLLFLAGLALLGTLIGLAFLTPAFVIFSPILVPAALAIGLALLGFLAAGVFGITALSSFSWLGSFIRRLRTPADNMDLVKRRVQDAAGQMGQKAKETGQTIQGKAREDPTTLEGQTT